MAYWNHPQSIKELSKHIIYKLGLISLLDKRRAATGHKVAHLKERSPADVFGAVYETGAWVMSDGQKALSGTGSEVHATANLRRSLLAVVERLECKTFLDVGCGDWTWMHLVDLPCDYIGVDIVHQVISANQKFFARPNVTFELADAVNGELPKADVAFAREILFHLSLEDGQKALMNIKKSTKWLAATTDRLWFNSDIRTGGFRMINLEIHPYDLRRPAFRIPDDNQVRGRTISVWPTSAIPEYSRSGSA